MLSGKIKTRRLTLFLLGLAAVAIGLVWLLAGRDLSLSVQMLPDGSELRLVKVSIGHETDNYCAGGTGERVLVGLLPASLKRPVNAVSLFNRTPNLIERIRLLANRHTLSMHPGTNSLVVFMMHRLLNTNRPPRLEVRAVDRWGEEIQTGISLWVHTISTNELLYGWKVPVFPRRDKTLRLRVYQDAGMQRWKPVAEFVAPNPARGQYPTWRAESLPATKHADDLEVTLIELLTGVRLLGREPAAPDQEGHILVNFRLAEEAQPISGWGLEGFKIFDATGNIWNCERYGLPISSSNMVRTAPGLLSTHETVKLRASFSRNDNFSANELWELKGLTLPAPGSGTQFASVDATCHRPGLSVSVTGLAVRKSKAENFLTLRVQVAPPQLAEAGWRLTLLEFADDQGRSLRRRCSTDLTATNYLHCGYPGDAKSADLTLAIHQARVVEFLALPRQMPVATSTNLLQQTGRRN